MAKNIISYNVNGIRAALKKDFTRWVDSNDFDIICLQETKANEEQVDVTSLENLGYKHHWFSAQKKGYSGVAIFSKVEPDKVVLGCGIEKYDFEGRIMRADFGDWSILNCYFPSGSSGELRQGFKMEFLADFFEYIEKLKQERPNLIIVGDYNIAHTEMDIHNPKSNKKSSGFLPEEREWMTKWLESGFTDAYRYLNPEGEEYSWWTYRSGARKNNKGWRIDYQSVSDNMQDKILESRQLGDAVHSDHCPVFMKIDL
ncbi:MAG: exodeoxyribonuclease-3 [Paraglaciecola sp.]|jgi:exodeoxyribonuclease-3